MAICCTLLYNLVYTKQVINNAVAGLTTRTPRKLWSFHVNNANVCECVLDNLLGGSIRIISAWCGLTCRVLHIVACRRCCAFRNIFIIRIVKVFQLNEKLLHPLPLPSALHCPQSTKYKIMQTSKKGTKLSKKSTNVIRTRMRENNNIETRFRKVS